MKKLLCIIIVLVTVLSFSATNVVFAVGDGSSTNPYLISKEADFSAAIEDTVNSTVYMELTDDITLSAELKFNKSKSYVLDLANHKITGAADADAVSVTGAASFTVSDGYLQSDCYAFNATVCESISLENVELTSTGLQSTLNLNNSKNVLIKNCSITYAGTSECCVIDIYADGIDCVITATDTDVLSAAYSEINYGRISPGSILFTLNGTEVINSSTNEDFNSIETETTHQNKYSADWKSAYVGGVASSAPSSAVYSDNTDKTLGLSYTVNGPSYAISIPSSAQFGTAVEVAVSDVAIPSSSTLTVKLTGATKDSTNALALKNEAGDYLYYTAYHNATDLGGAANWVSSGTVLTLSSTQNTILSVQTGTSNASRFLFFKKTDGLYPPGKYEGNLTFTFAIEDTE